MGGSRLLQLVAGLLAALLPAAAAAVGMQPGAPCEPTLLATQLAVFCAPDVPTAPCCEPVVFAVDIGGDIPCICRVAAEPELAAAGFSAAHLLTLYTSCGGLRPGGAHLAAACEGPAPQAAIVSSVLPPPPPSTAPRRREPAHDAPPPPSSEKLLSPPPQVHDGAAPHAKAAPAQAATSRLAPAAAGALPPHSPAFIFVAAAQPTHPATTVISPSSAPQSPHAPSPSPSSEAPSSHDGAGAVVVLILGYIFTMALYLSSIPTIWHICREANVGNYKVDMFMVTLSRCIVWVFYGLPDDRWPLVAINAVGVAIQIVYLVLFLWHSPPVGKVRMVIILVLIVGLSGVLAAAAFSLPKDPRILLGVIGDFTSILMYAGPLRQLISVWTTHDVANMSLLVGLFSLLNGVCWTSYGFMVRPHDVFIIVPNIVGIVSGACQVMTWVKFRFFP